MQDEIKTIRERINGRTSDKQGITRNPFEITVMNRLQQAQQYIGSKMVAPGNQEEILLALAEESVKNSVQQINTFFSDKWKVYRQQVEATKVNLFKDYKPIE